MFLFSHIVLVLMSSVLPMLAILLYCFNQEGGWKPAIKGASALILSYLCVWMILPAIFYYQDWFQQVLAQTSSFAIVYCATFAFLILAFTLLFYGRSFKRERSSHALLIGFVEGACYEAIFIGFIAINSLFTGLTPSGNPDEISNLWMAMVEAVAMMILFAGFTFQMKRAITNRRYWMLLVVYLEVFLLLYVGVCWIDLWHLPRIAQEVLLVALSIATIYFIHRHFKWKYLLKDEEAEPIVESE